VPAPIALPAWPRALGATLARAKLRARPEDFEVEELPAVSPEGEGSHLWLEVRKRGANTQWVAGQLARCAGAPARDVGYAGMKDRHAVTTQWFSIGLQEAADDDWSGWTIAGCEILQAVRHPRKLRTGTLRGNRFRLIARDLEGSREELCHSLEVLAQRGYPNYFGPQRFGRDGANLRRGADWLQRRGRARRADRSLWLSAVRSFLFNEVLAARVRDCSWDGLLDGEVAMLDGSRSTFRCRLPDADLERRCVAFDLHPTGPLAGRGGTHPDGVAAALEAEALEPFGDLVDGLVGVGAEAGRRSLRVHPAGLEWRFNGSTLLLEFTLPPGAYATSLLREVLTADGLQ
jgi:tRNA pseudouridine13 synthase